MEGYAENTRATGWFRVPGARCVVPNYNAQPYPLSKYKQRELMHPIPLFSSLPLSPSLLLSSLSVESSSSNNLLQSAKYVPALRIAPCSVLSISVDIVGRLRLTVTTVERWCHIGLYYLLWLNVRLSDGDYTFVLSLSMLCLNDFFYFYF